MSRPTKAQRRFATVALAFCAVWLVAFSVAQMVIFCVTGTEQTELINMTFTVIGVECGGLLIKRIADKIFENRSKEDNGYD